MDLCVLDMPQFSMLAMMIFFGYRSIYYALTIISADDEEKREFYSNKSTSFGPVFILGAVIALYILSCQS
jgi:hypothetical protein